MDNNSFVLYVNDAETTGLDSQLHDIIEISMCRLTHIKNGEYADEQKTWKVKAQNPKTISDEALKVNGHKREDILGISKYGRETYLDPKQVIEEIELWMLEDNVSSVDRIFVGQNPKFDLDMMTAMWTKNGKSMEDFPFACERGKRILDTAMIVALFDVCTGKRRKNYSLGKLIKACGVKKDKAHSADGDVRMTRDLFLKCISIIFESVAANFQDCYNEGDE